MIKVSRVPGQGVGYKIVVFHRLTILLCWWFE